MTGSGYEEARQGSSQPGNSLGSHDDLRPPTPEEVLDEYLAVGDDDSEDEEIEEYLERAFTPDAGGHREMVSALSALSAQMGRYRPLTIPEQRAAFATYNAGLEAAATLALNKRITARRRAALEKDVRAGDDAHSALVGSMFRLVLLIARELSAQRYGRERALDLLPDLVADANVALVEAVASFDPTRGPAYSVYAGRVVRERVRGSLTKSSPLGIPASWMRVKRLATTLTPELAANLGRQPTVAEIQEGLRAQCMVWAANRLTEAQRALDEPTRRQLMEQKLVKQGMIGAIDRYEEVMIATRSVESLDAPIGDSDGSRHGDTLANADDGRLFDDVELAELRRSLMTALAELPARDREIVLHRFGFVDGEVWTYAKLAPRYSISAERVRQIERNALTKLRGPGFTYLGGFFPEPD